MDFFDLNKEQNNVYKKSLSLEIIFQIRFVDNLTIPEETPVKFQSLMRGQGYPNFNLGVSNFPNVLNSDVADVESLNKILSNYIFASSDINRPYQVSISKDSLSFTHSGPCKSEEDFRSRMIKVLESFFESYDITTIKHIGLRHRNILNSVYISSVKEKGLEYFIPEHILPKIRIFGVDSVKYADSRCIFKNGIFNVSLGYALDTVSGLYGLYNLNNAKSYFIDIDCYVTNDLEQEFIKNVSDYYKSFSKIYSNVFEWSITEELREILR